MREKLLKSLRYTLSDAESWLELAKHQTNIHWLDDMGEYLYNLGRAYQTALILKADYNENGEEVRTASKMRLDMQKEVSAIQELHQEEKTTCAHSYKLLPGSYSCQL